MSRVDELLKNYSRYVSLPWDNSLPGAQRVWFAVYDPADERRLRLRMPDFEIATKDAGHGWMRCDLSDAFASWMSSHTYREEYFQSSEDLGTPHPGFEKFVAELVHDKLEKGDENAVVAVSGVSALFGFMKISRLVSMVEDSIRGRLLVFFPGSYENNHYRFLDARDGWNYHAVPITAAGGLESL